MKKIFKKKWFWIVVIVVILVGGGAVWAVLGNKPAAVEYTTEPVKKGALAQTVTATGNVQSSADIQLNFKNTGRIVSLPVTEGDKVKAGQVLAQLDSAGLAAQIAQNRANLAAAQAELARIEAGASTEDINVSAEQVNKTEQDIISLTAERDSELAVLTEKLVDAIDNSLFASQVALDTVYNNFLNEAQTRNLQFNDGNLRNRVSNDYGSAQQQFMALKNDVAAAKQANTRDAVIATADLARDWLVSLNQFLKSSFSLGDAIITNATYTQSIKDTIKADVSTQQTSVNTVLSSVQAAKSGLVNGVASYNSQLQAAQSNLAIYRAQLALKSAGPRSFEIQSAQAKVAQARATLNQSLATSRDYTVVAPIAGTVTQVNGNVGEQSAVSTPIIKMIGTEKFEIKVDIPESDIAKVTVGTKTVVKLDAFGSDHQFKGVVTFIDPAQTVIQDVIYYKTTVSLEADDFNERIKPGMSADITMMTAEKADVLYVPQRAVKVKQTTLDQVPAKFVEILVGGQPQEKEVVTGLRGDNGLVEIISGVNEGDLVITFKKTNQ